MKKYQDLLDQLLRSIEKRDGLKPASVADKHNDATHEGMCREGICQILAHEKRGVRCAILLRFPSLIIPYLFRIREKKKVD